ncbi:MAG: protein translocase subunit SecD [Treponemataceae bacterium]
MKKRTRLVIVLLVLALCFLFLLPTLRWYFWTSKEDKALATESREKIRDYAVSMASKDLDFLINAAKSASTEALDKERFSALIKQAQKNNKSLKLENPSVWTATEVLKAFPSVSETQARKEIANVIEGFYRDRILKIKRQQANAVKLGLDLSGGMSLIIKADLSAIENVAEVAPDEETPKVETTNTNESSETDSETEEPKSEDNKAEKQKEKRQVSATTRQEAMALAIETLRGRIDRFGLSEPIIRQQGEDRIYIELPGATDADLISSIIMGRGILAFHIVDEEATNQFYQYYNANKATTFDANYNLIDPTIIPEDTMVLGVYYKDAYGIDQRNEAQPFLVVKKKPGLEGKYLASVETARDNTGQPIVEFTLDSEGADIFAKLTTENEKKRLAIVSDTKIKSAPNINTPITGGRGMITGFSAEEAENLKAVLRSAWLNVPLELENQQVIGATMGKQSIDQGLNALFWGLIAVFVFMLVYYLEAGINACVAQILNLYIMFSILSALNLTLSLSSIAGMILTIGMAVDANVVIFERIKEELLLGKSRAVAINAGFDQAFWAIMDSNITTFIAAAFLSVLGTGTIKGFAYSLAIGVISSVFTALFVSRLIFDFGTETIKLKNIKISWRKYN